MPFFSSSESLLQNKCFIYKKVYTNFHSFSTSKGNIAAKTSTDIITKYRKNPLKMPLHRKIRFLSYATRFTIRNIILRISSSFL